jgi:hypothetical protein
MKLSVMSSLGYCWRYWLSCRACCINQGSARLDAQ